MNLVSLWLYSSATSHNAIPLLNQQDLQAFVAPPDEYILEHQANLTIEDIAAAYAPQPHPPANSTEETTSTARLWAPISYY